MRSNGPDAGKSLASGKQSNSSAQPVGNSAADPSIAMRAISYARLDEPTRRPSSLAKRACRLTCSAFSTGIGRWALGEVPTTHSQAEGLAKRFGVHWRTIYRYRSRLREVDEATAIAGRKRGWKPLVSRLSAKQELAIEEAINTLRKRPGPVRAVDLVEEVSARCRLRRLPCPSRPAIDRRLKRASGVKVHRRGTAMPGSADPKTSPGSFVVQRPLDVVQIDHPDGHRCGR